DRDADEHGVLRVLHRFAAAAGRADQGGGLVVDVGEIAGDRDAGGRDDDQGDPKAPVAHRPSASSSSALNDSPSYASGRTIFGGAAPILMKNHGGPGTLRAVASAACAATCFLTDSVFESATSSFALRPLTP